MSTYTIPANPNPAWVDPEHTVLDIDVEFEHLSGERVRFTANPNDTAADYTHEILTRAAAGEFGPIAPFAPTERPASPDWSGFLAAMRQTTVFASLRGQARVDVAANALATELRMALGEAALGLVEVEAVQGLVDELLPSLAPEQVAEIQEGITAFHIPLTVS